MIRRRPVLTAALAVATLAAPLCAAFGACGGDGPEAVLNCFSAAYSNRDAATLESVLAPDYVWMRVAPPEAEIFTRETSFEASVRMFRDPEVEYVALNFDEGYHVVAGDEPDTWRIQDLRATLVVRLAGDIEPRVTPLCVTLYVRLTDDGTTGYEVYREVFFEGDGCVRAQTRAPMSTPLD